MLSYIHGARYHYTLYTTTKYGINDTLTNYTLPIYKYSDIDKSAESIRLKMYILLVNYTPFR